jgi:hypothetical protein
MLKIGVKFFVSVQGFREKVTTQVDRLKVEGFYELNAFLPRGKGKKILCALRTPVSGANGHKESLAEAQREVDGTVIGLRPRFLVVLPIVKTKMDQTSTLEEKYLTVDYTFNSSRLACKQKPEFCTRLRRKRVIPIDPALQRVWHWFCLTTGQKEVLRFASQRQ